WRPDARPGAVGPALHRLGRPSRAGQGRVSLRRRHASRRRRQRRPRGQRGDGGVERPRAAPAGRRKRPGDGLGGGSAMRWAKTVTVVGAHAEGEIGRVIVGGVLPPPGTTMFERMKHLETKADDLRQMLLFDPRGNVTMSMNLVLPPCDPRADVGLIVMESRYYVPMSGSNTICTVTVLLETGMGARQDPATQPTPDPPGGLVGVTAPCRNGKCERVSFRNVPSFVFHRDRPVEVEGLGTITVDAAYGGMIYALVDA